MTAAAPVARGGDAPASPPPTAVLVIPGSHLDVGFTAPPSVVRAKRVATLDAAIDAAEQDPEFRWTEECAWVVHAWLDAHEGDDARLARLRALVAQGRIGIGASYVNPHAALFPTSLHLLFAFDDTVEKVLGVRPRVAIVNDVPSLPEAFVDAARTAGVEMVICGTNLAFSRPIPGDPTRAPFRWRSWSGASVVVAIDPDSYTSAFTRWGIDPDAARFWAADRFGAASGLDVAARGIEEMGRGRRGTAIVQQAFDNGGTETAKRLPAFCRAWNASRSPPVRAGVPADALASWRGEAIEVRRGEWGGTWETVRAGCPDLTARLRRAAARTTPDVPLARRLAIATAMDHTGGLGPGWPGLLTEDETVAHAAQWAAILDAAIGPARDEALEAIAAGVAERLFDEMRGGGLLHAALRIDGVERVRGTLRVAPSGIGGPTFGAGARDLDAPCGVWLDRGRLRLWAVLDRAAIAGDDAGSVDVGWDVPLDASTKDVAAWPAGASTAASGTWLMGSRPETFVAPSGLVVVTPSARLLVSSEHAFTYRLVDVGGRAHVTALLVRQSRSCELKGGTRKVLPFERLYPGEPRTLVASLVVAKDGE